MGFIKEFQEFAVKGNVMDMAVGVIIGGAFGKIVASLVNDVIMPPLGLITGNGFTDLKLVLKPATAAVTSLLLKLQKLHLTMETLSRILLTLSSLLLLSSYSLRA